MPHDQALVMASGYGLPPFIAEKKPYFVHRAYTGLYGPNPYFDRELSAVSVPGGLRRGKTLRVIRETVPASHAHLPQYAHGEWTFIESYRPKS